MSCVVFRWCHVNFALLRFCPFVFTETVSYEEIFPGNFGVGGVKKFLGKKTFLTRKNFPPFLTRKFLQEILGLEGSKNFLGKFRQVHNLNISDRCLRPKSFFQENIPGFICSVFCSA